MSKPLEKLPHYISAIAAIIVLLACILIGAPLYWMAAWVSFAIALFYVIGQVLRYFLVSQLYPHPLEEEELHDDEYSPYDGISRDPDEEEVDVSDLLEDDDEGEMEAESEPVEDAFLDS